MEAPLFPAILVPFAILGAWVGLPFVVQLGFGNSSTDRVMVGFVCKVIWLVSVIAFVCLW